MRNALKRYGPAAVGVAVVIGIFGFALPRIADYRDVIDVVSTLSFWEIVGLAVATLWNVFTFAPPWRAAMPGLSMWRALVMTQASTAAASALPGGEAVGLGLGFGMLRTWGFRSGAIAAAVALVTVMNTLAKVLLPAAALVGLLVTGRQGGLLGLLTVIGIGALGLLFGAAVDGASYRRQHTGVRRTARRVANPRADPAAAKGLRIVSGPAESLPHRDVRPPAPALVCRC